MKVRSSTMEVEMMDMLMEEGCDNEQYSGCSSTSTIEDENIVCNWNSWSPVIDWNPFCGDADDLDNLIESMICGDKNTNVDIDGTGYEYWNGMAGSEILVHEPSSTATSEGTPPLHPTEEVRLVGAEGDDKGLRLVHLLIAAAEALKGPHRSWDLARVILVRLRELVSPAAAEVAGGTNMERLAAHFTDTLQGLLDGPAGARSGGGSHHDPQHQPGDVLGAFQLLQDMSPYVKFGHFTANQAILESVAGDRRVHVVDYDIMEGVQWASLMQAMVSSKDGSPPPHLRISAIVRGSGGSSGSSRRKPMVSVQETGRRLVAFAASIGQPFSFGQCRLDPDENFHPNAVKVVKGETVIANCILHPQHRSAPSIASFLTGAATLGAKIITLVEEEREVIVKGDDTENGFVGRFMDELHRYSAIWDSLEAGFPMQGWARGLVERVILGPRIADAVARAYHQKEEENGEGGSWGTWMSLMGFGGIGISFFSHCQARLLLGLFNDGYKVEEDAPNKLVLGWKSRRLISASIWSSPPPSPPPSTASGFT